MVKEKKTDLCDRCGKKVGLMRVDKGLGKAHKVYCGFKCAYKTKSKKPINEEREDAKTSTMIGIIAGQLLWWFVLDKIAELIWSIFGLQWSFTTSLIFSIIFTILTIGAMSIALQSNKALRKQAYGK